MLESRLWDSSGVRIGQGEAKGSESWGCRVFPLLGAQARVFPQLFHSPAHTFSTLPWSGCKQFRVLLRVWGWTFVSSGAASQSLHPAGTDFLGSCEGPVMAVSLWAFRRCF